MRAVTNGFIKWTHSNGTSTYKVMEATQPLPFKVDKKDITKAGKLNGTGNPNVCVAACAVRRQYADAAFQRDTAYVLQVHRGKVVATRYRLGATLRRAVSEFDSGGIFPAGLYELKAITPSQTLEAKRARAKKPKSKNKRYVRPHFKFTERGKILPTS